MSEGPRDMSDIVVAGLQVGGGIAFVWALLGSLGGRDFGDSLGEGLVIGAVWVGLSVLLYFGGYGQN